MSRYSKDISYKIEKLLRFNGFEYRFNEKMGSFEFIISGFDSEIEGLDFLILVHEGAFSVYAYSNLKVDTDDCELKASMSEFICRINYGMRIGNFEFDLDNGNIFFKAFANCKGENLPTDEMLKIYIFAPVESFKKYAKGMINIINKKRTAKEAIAVCEI
ncbi:hypothetical protein SAMN05216249_1307 [Acetitomaculum ruminis DSM 5522]|uniref:Sensory transduction regulator n=1 Tax=Acetitomaculum ruminis DSM 5522 TaxID=1120918 RepID=A0A1I1AQG6_9FIRM|nr:hypothetical protein [Acetitomaculum ruminis]SFB38583.1 hypothetical protein SAMN05216249_1307 [Acetitomaculum ruminis DSM 5522]